MGYDYLRAFLYSTAILAVPSIQIYFRLMYCPCPILWGWQQCIYYIFVYSITIRAEHGLFTAFVYYLLHNPLAGSSCIHLLFLECYLFTGFLSMLFLWGIVYLLGFRIFYCQMKSTASAKFASPLFTNCSLVTAYGDIDFGQHLLR